MSVILLFTGLAGFLTTYSLLYLGIPWMWLRYPIAILLAYSVFLLLLRLWLGLQQTRLPRVSLDVDVSTVDFSSNLSACDGAHASIGGGGDFGGGGSSGSWGSSVSSAPAPSSGGSFLNGTGFDFDLQEGFLIVLALLALFGGLLASLYVVYIAPGLLAEILIDGALIAGLYKRVQQLEQRNWLRTAVRRTLLPAVLAVIFFTIAGAALQKAAPEARSMGEVWGHIQRRRALNHTRRAAAQDSVSESAGIPGSEVRTRLL